MDIANIVIRQQPSLTWQRVVLAGLGGVLTIGVIAAGADVTHMPLLAASFGASCVLVFTMPEAPVSQPINVVAGHLVTTFCGLVALLAFPVTWWSLALAAGGSIAAMAALRVTHPPAGANPIVVMSAGAGWSYLVTPILIGALTVVLVGVVFHRLTGAVYPKRRIMKVSHAGKGLL